MKTLFISLAEMGFTTAGPRCGTCNHYERQ